MADREPASARTISIHDGTPRPWAQAGACLAQAPTYWLATARPGGRPHLVPVLGVWVDGAPHFVANPSSRKARNLAANARCVIAVSGDGLDVVIEGEATQMHDQPTLRRVAEAYASKYDWHVTRARRCLSRHARSAHRRPTPLPGVPGRARPRLRLRHKRARPLHPLALPAQPHPPQMILIPGGPQGPGAWLHCWLHAERLSASSWSCPSFSQLPSPWPCPLCPGSRSDRAAAWP